MRGYVRKDKVLEPVGRSYERQIAHAANRRSSTGSVFVNKNRQGLGLSNMFFTYGIINN